MSNTIKEKIADIQENLLAAKEMGQEFMFQVMIDYGKKVGEFPKDKMCEANQVHGCQSTVYINAYKKDDLIYFQGFADSRIVAGELYLLLEALSGSTSNQIVNEAKEIIDDFVEETGFIADLTPSRANAFGSMFKMMKRKAEILGKE
jgi:cysteine desulfuration protein SufE